MPNQFIPGFHMVAPEEKLTPKWCSDAMSYLWYSTSNRSLLWNKNVKEIEEYSVGKFDMTEYKKMYKSEQKRLEQKGDPNVMQDGQSSSALDYTCLPLIPTKLNSAISIIQKIPVEVTCIALDPLAAEKKEEDLNFIKNKPQIESDLQDISDKMNLGKVDLGTTKHSSTKFSDSPYGLDLNEPDELEVFVNLLYSLQVESALETVLQEFWNIKNGNQIKLLEIRDQFKFGVSAHQAFQSAITGLPDAEYIYPENVKVPSSDLPDLGDNTHRFIENKVTALELMNFFSNEICDLDQLNTVINGTDKNNLGYCACNKMDRVDRGNFGTFAVDLVYCEIKSIDWIGVTGNPKSKRGYNYFLANPTKEEAEKCTNKIWGQNTYAFWWLKNTKHYFGIHRLGFAHRSKGQESYQNFSTNIYRSQARSCVELAIGENKKAQIADIKMQHAIIQSLPAGKAIDLRFLRNALSGLKQEHTQHTMEDLLALAFEKNVVLMDTEGFEGKNDGQFRPIWELAGGLKSEVTGYMQVIVTANGNIERFTGINEQLTGQGGDPNTLVGLEKLRINGSLNSLYYANEAISNQYQKLFTLWASVVKKAVEDGGKSKEAIKNLIGAKKVTLIDGIDDVPLHTIGVKVSINQREEERAKFENDLMMLKQQGIIDVVGEYMLNGIQNPKDKMALLAVKYKQWMKRADAKQQQQFAQQQQLAQQQGQNQVAAKAAEAQGEKELAYAKGDVQANLLTLASQHNMSLEQLEGIIKKQLQDERNAGQIDKTLRGLQTKSALEQQAKFA